MMEIERALSCILWSMEVLELWNCFLLAALCEAITSSKTTRLNHTAEVYGSRNVHFRSRYNVRGEIKVSLIYGQSTIFSVFLEVIATRTTHCQTVIRGLNRNNKKCAIHTTGANSDTIAPNPKRQKVDTQDTMHKAKDKTWHPGALQMLVR